ncbi:MAG: 2-amino-4-hydroxy-6-hydroxymethyldihydropteridine diphosphokinase [Burkholderiales bacterium]|nr:2-amino-4-hydroxy-6-hydroxymethyldihydropteridine diphosphokinase [Burkholderiales bacterium]
MRIIINGITDEVFVGCYEHEKLHKQPIVLNLVCDLYAHTWITDDNLENTVHYDELVDFAKALLSNKRYNLLEAMSQFIALEILNKFALVEFVQIELLKPALHGIKAMEIKVSHTLRRKFKVALALGSNNPYLPQQQVITAIELLGQYLDDINIGNFYKTAPFGGVKQDDFINTAIIGYTSLKPNELLAKIKIIEKLMGKHEVVINGPRIIDIDIILFDNLVYKHNYLQIPHKDMHQRDFVLVPLADVAANWLHPTLKMTVLELRDNLLLGNSSNILEQVGYYKNEI